ncbi:peroxiredoxin [bacterium]|nr:peroxiredoxin [bacterium]MDE6224458.1 peroxiredoxin [Alphaproteobacteria bacterium]
MEETFEHFSFPIIGSIAPSFEAETTQGKISFPNDYKGKWIILFSHPSDFTPVCTTEFMAFASMGEEFESLNTQLVGLSIDGITSHIAWLRTIKEKIEYKGMKNVCVKFPLIADLKMDIAKKYGMIQETSSDTKTVRAVFIIDPDSKVRAIFYYPSSVGRNIEEIKRALIALQTSDGFKVSIPVNWQAGDDVIIPTENTCQGAMSALNSEDKTCLDWFLCLKRLPKERVFKKLLNSKKE